MDRFGAHLRTSEPGVRELIGRVPLLSTPPLPPAWLRCEVLERLEVLRHAPLEGAETILEVGSGPHAIATLPLAYLAGPDSRIIAAERSRWGEFQEIVRASGMGHRIWPVACDARRLPLRESCVDLAVCVHGLRSLQGETDSVRVLREMLRVAPRALLAESLPIARTEAQRAHLAMYDLREELFVATSGAKDDFHYVPLDRLVSIAEKSGGTVETAETLEVDLPHFLGYFPRALAERIDSSELRERLLEGWDKADAMRRRYGEDHPPVGVVLVKRPYPPYPPRAAGRGGRPGVGARILPDLDRPPSRGPRSRTAPGAVAGPPETRPVPSLFSDEFLCP